MIKRLIGRVLFGGGVVVTIAIALLAIGAAAGRGRVAITPTAAPRATTPAAAVAPFVPVPSATLKAGDEFVARLRPREAKYTYRVAGVVDARAREMRVRDSTGEIYTGTLPNIVWRVRFVAPAIGPVFDAF